MEDESMKRILSMVIIFMIIMGGSIVFFGIDDSINGRLLNDTILTMRSPILIDGNTDFTSGNGVSSGSGSVSDPYIIENWKISAKDGHGIYIMDTDVYFIIKNCMIENGGELNYNGIYFDNIRNGSIENCLFENNGDGVFGCASMDITVHNNTYNNNGAGILFYEGSRNITITNNTLSSNREGILLWSYVDRCYVANNTIRSSNLGIRLLSYCDHNIVEYNNILETYGKGSSGIKIDSGSNNVIRYNNCSGNFRSGISFIESNDNLIQGNIFMNNKTTGDRLRSYGIMLSSSKNNMFKYNSLINCGIRFYWSEDNDTISNSIDNSNKVNGKDIVFLKESSTEQAITGDYGLVILVKCENKIIEDMSFDDISPGITIIDSSRIKVQDIVFRNSAEGILVESSSWINIHDIEIRDFYSGIFFEECRESGVYNSSFLYGQCGIMCFGTNNSTIEYNEMTSVVEGIYYQTKGSGGLIKENVVSGGRRGMWIEGSDHRVIRNVIDSNTDRGLGINCEGVTVLDNQIIGNGVGIVIRYITDTLIENNVIMCNREGIVICTGVNGVVIRKNNISSNEEYGIDIQFNFFEIQNCSIHQNIFYGNNNNSVQTRDRMQTCNWDDGISLGNYWSDYENRYVPPATNNGTIWNISYVVDGGTSSKDNYPLVSPPISLPKTLRISRNHKFDAPIDRDYSVEYWALYSGDRPDNISWAFSTNAGWLSFGADHILKGKPTMSNLGTYWVNISVNDGTLFDFTNFTVKIIVKNFPPNIITTDVLSVDQWQKYRVDYDATDDDKILEWNLVTEAGFLTIDQTTGILSGTPGLNDTGTFFVNVSVNDGELEDIAHFYLTVVDVNDPPMQNYSFSRFLLLEDTTPTYLISDIFFNYDNDPLNVSVSGITGVNVSLEIGDYVRIIPDNDWYGKGVLDFVVTDGHYNMSFPIEVIVQSVNDAPRNLVISFASVNLFEGDDQTVSAEYFDPDIGDSNNVTWYIDGDAVSNNFSYNLSLPAGSYNLTLRVTDSFGNYTEQSVYITVEKGRVIIPNPSNPNQAWLFSLIISFSILLLIGAAIFIVRKRAGHEKETKVASPPPPASISTGRPGATNHGLGPRTRLDMEDVNCGLLDTTPFMEMEDAIVEHPWSGRFDDELEEIMLEALENQTIEYERSSILSLIKKMKRKQLDDERHSGDFQKLITELDRISEE